MLVGDNGVRLDREYIEDLKKIDLNPIEETLCRRVRYLLDTRAAVIAWLEQEKMEQEKMMKKYKSAGGIIYQIAKDRYNFCKWFLAFIRNPKEA